jgi:putative ABC transport system permease protein
MFRQPGRVTAVAIRLRDPALLGEAATRLQEIPGAQVATMTEMMGTFLNLIGAVRTLVLAVALVALTISALAVFTTMLSSVLERTGELAILRAIGASRLHLFGLLTLEALLLTVCGCLGGLLLALLGGRAIESVIERWVTLMPTSAMLTLTGNVMAQCFTVATVMGLLAGLYPAWKASRLHPAQALRTEG